MHRQLRSHLTFANVTSLIALFAALGGTTYAATGGNFILGNPNSASSTTSLSAPTAGKALQVTNTSTAAGATALGLNVASGHSPFTINSGTKVTNLNADKIDGIDSSGFLPSASVKHLIYTASATSSSSGAPITPIATVGPYTIKGQCENTISNNFTHARIYVRGIAGTADSLWSETQNDSTDLGTHSTGLLIPANTDLQIVDVNSDSGNYSRGGGTSMLRSGSVIVQVDFHAVADHRGAPGSCFIYGTATRAT
jgi:hypothetical protein